MKIAVICDLHLPETKTASQYSALEWAVNDIKDEKPVLTVVAGDITASGDMAPMMHFVDGLKGLHHILLLGNADLRNENSIEQMTKLVPHSRHIVMEGREIIGLNTPKGKIEADARFLLETCKDGSIIFAHHYPDALEEDSREYLKSLLARKKLTYIHGHKHIEMESTIENSKVIGVRGLDPDKACGVPCVSYFEFNDDGFDKYEKCFEMPSDNLGDFWDYLGLSCFSPEVDIDYAIDRGIQNIEIRKYGGPETFGEIVSKAKKWREHGGRYLSVHMPNLRLKEGKIEGIQQWDEAVMLCNALDADGVTVHVPRVSICDMEAGGPVWCEFLEIMTDKISQLPQKTKVGIENIHMPPRMQDIPEREFGCVPEECLSWINAVNQSFGYERAGALLDVGHASNNSVFNNRYTRSVWYEMMGDKTVAYHIHQVTVGEKGLINHNAIEDWFGPKISYFSFWWAWQNNHINHAPMFLEVKNKENGEKSLKSFEEKILKMNIFSK